MGKLGTGQISVNYQLGRSLLYGSRSLDENGQTAWAEQFSEPAALSVDCVVQYPK